MSNMIEITDAERRLAERITPDAGGALAISANAGGISFTNAQQAMDFAKMMAVSNVGVRKHLRGNVGACLAIVVQAVEWGVSPYAVANKSYFVNDQIAFESQLVQAVILRRAPIRGRIKFEFAGSGQARRCRAWARLREDDEVVEYLSPELKDIAVKNSPLWKADPDQQFSYYAGRALCRRHFPDVLLGIYTEDDFAAVAAPGPENARDVTPPRGLGAKLDALAANPEPEQSVAPDEIDQDPDIGEVHEDAPPLDREGDADPEPSPKDRLLDRLHAAAMESEGKLKRAIGGLTGEEQKLVTPADLERIRAAARQAAGATP